MILRLFSPASIFSSCLLAAGVAPAQTLPDVFLEYSIEVSLDPATRMLDGRETIRWTNPSATVSVDRIPLHLYLNAFSHESTTWSGSASAMGIFDPDAVIELHDDPWGWSEPISIRQDGTDLEWRPISPDDGNSLDRSLIEVALAESIAPGETLVLEVEFDARLPVPIARTGGYEDYFLVAQWFPKISVFETAGLRRAGVDGFNAHQFHGPTEFYADYADFEVSIGVPADWHVAATGRRSGQSESDGLVWHEYRQRAVHDFAFAAALDFVDLVSTHAPAGPGTPLEVHIFMPAENEDAAARWRRAIEGALDTLGARVGPYPYETITLVLPPFRHAATGGMEYPTLFTGLFDDAVLDLGPIRTVRLGEDVIAHEFAHQYFYGLVGTSEVEEAFLDEGFTQYWGIRALVETYSDGMGQLLGRPIDAWYSERAQVVAGTAAPPLISRPSYLLRGISIGGQFYARPALTLKTLENRFGRDVLDSIFSTYYMRWRFRHPGFEDFLDVARDVAGEGVAAFIEDAFSQDGIPDYRVESMNVEPWRAPRGRLVTDERVISPDESREGLDLLTGFEDADDSSIRVARLDAGTPADDRWANAEVFTVTPVRGVPDESWEPPDDVRYFDSAVEIRGPGWRELPVDVEFRFADGATFRERWDGRSETRIYRFLRPVPLSEVVIDPEGVIALDTNLANNGRRRASDREFARDWAFWVAGVGQLIAEGLTSWL